MKYLKTNRLKAFTLIELLIVITIIGILAAIVMINLDDVQSKSRDARRKSDLNTIAKAVQLYENQYNTFQICDDGTSRECGYKNNGYGYFNYSGIGEYNTSINQALIDLRLLSGTVIDPTGGTNRGYFYMYMQNMTDATKGGSVYAKLEDNSQADPSSITNSANLTWGNDPCPDPAPPGCITGYNMNYAINLIP